MGVEVKADHQSVSPVAVNAGHSFESAFVRFCTEHTEDYLYIKGVN